MPDDLGGAILGAVGIGDADGDGVPEVYAADFEGKVYGWGADGSRVFEEESNPDYSGKPLTPFVNVRKGKANRTQHGFFGAPVLADLDGDGEAGGHRLLDGPPRLRLERVRLRPERSRRRTRGPGLPGPRRRPREGRLGRPRHPRDHLRRRGRTR